MYEKTLVHTANIDVRWGDLDAYGHVNNTSYFLYVQEARFDFLYQYGIPVGLNDTFPVLASTSCKFLLPIFYPEKLLINTFITELSGKKFVLEHNIHSAGNTDILYAKINALNVWYDFKRKKSVLVPDYVVKLVNQIKEDIRKS